MEAKKETSIEIENMPESKIGSAINARIKRAFPKKKKKKKPFEERAFYIF